MAKAAQPFPKGKYSLVKFLITIWFLLYINFVLFLSILSWRRWRVDLDAINKRRWPGHALNGHGYPEAGNKKGSKSGSQPDRDYDFSQLNPPGRTSTELNRNEMKRITGTTQLSGGNCQLHSSTWQLLVRIPPASRFFVPLDLARVFVRAFGKLTAADTQFECKPQNWIISQWQSRGSSQIPAPVSSCAPCACLIPSPWYMRREKSFPGALAGDPTEWGSIPSQRQTKRQWLCGSVGRMLVCKINFTSESESEWGGASSGVLLPAGCFMACFTYVRT